MNAFSDSTGLPHARRLRASLTGDQLLHSHDRNIWFRGDIVGRNWMLVILRGQRVKARHDGIVAWGASVSIPAKWAEVGGVTPCLGQATKSNVMLILRQLPKEYNLLGCSYCGKYYIFTLNGWDGNYAVSAINFSNFRTFANSLVLAETSVLEFCWLSYPNRVVIIVSAISMSLAYSWGDNVMARSNCCPIPRAKSGFQSTLPDVKFFSYKRHKGNLVLSSDLGDWRRANARNISLKTPYDGQFTLSTIKLILPSYSSTDMAQEFV